MELYRKYRPRTFAEMVDLSFGLLALSDRVYNGNPPNVILFHGDSGVGKTTASRIFAETIGAVRDTIKEYNTSNTRGIDTIREIIEEIRYPSPYPVVYILDEAHKLSADAQEALLKPLEDHPEGVYFCICTTEPQKLKRTLRSRATEIELKPLTSDGLLTILRRTAKAEGKKAPADVYERIIEIADGSGRKALMLFEHVMSLPAEAMLDALASPELSSAAVIDLCRALTSRANWGHISSIIKLLETTDYEAVRYAVLGYASSVLLGRGDHQSALVIEAFKEPFYNSGKAGLLYACYSAINLK